MSRARRRHRFALAAAVLALPVTSIPVTSLVAPTASAAPAHHRLVEVCAAPAAGRASCDAILDQAVTPAGQLTPAASTPQGGYAPADLQSAYGLAAAAASAGGSQKVAIVDAYNDPDAAADLGVYRSEYGLPACTTANGCFTQVGQTGRTTSLPANNASWSEEISLDLDMVSAVCPNCKILLVEANSPTVANLGTAVDEAVDLGATEVSNSYGGSESSSDKTYDTDYYKHSGVAITASAGDDGYGAEYPASSRFVTAVGGTTLDRASNARGWSETAWDDTGSGCSADDAQESWQAALATVTSTCSRRAVADVSADADPDTGVNVYDSYSYEGEAGWLVFGGTSVASPIIAGTYALAGNAASVTYGSYPYAHPSALNDVTSGSNGGCGTDECKATTGWDGPTGLGTPSGTGAF